MAKAFTTSSHVAQVTLCSELSKEYKNEMGEETAVYLAAQVVNFLQGEDINQIIQNAQEPLKTQIIKIKDQVETRAHEKMAKDRDTRELVVYTLRIKTVFNFDQQGNEYLESDEQKRIEKILLRYGKEFPQEPNISAYTLMVQNYYQNRHIK